MAVIYFMNAAIEEDLRAEDHLTTRSASWLKRIACISTSRADAGIYRPLLERLAGEDAWNVSLLAGGTHFDESFGNTGRELHRIPGIELHEVAHFVRGDSPERVSRSTGQAVTAFGRVIEEARPDLVFVLGDRTEMLASALAATIYCVPIAHLHGGDTTRGACDDACRHAITKLAHVHFPALAQHAERIVQMGEERWRVHTVGALAVDTLRQFVPLTRDELFNRLGIDFVRPTGVVAYYPETMSDVPIEEQIAVVSEALDLTPLSLLLIGPNADVGHESIRSDFKRLASVRPSTKLLASLTQQEFWSCLAHATVLVGNSSAGILEAASFGLPVVDIGDRQSGRLRSENVIHAPLDASSISAAIQRAATAEFREGLANVVNGYGDGNAAERVIEVLWTLPARATVLRK